MIRLMLCRVGDTLMMETWTVVLGLELNVLTEN